MHHWNFWSHLQKSSQTTKIFPYISYWHFISETIKWSFTPMLTGKHRQSYIQKPIYNRYKKTAAEVIQDPVTFVHHWNFWSHLQKSSQTTKIFPYISYWHFISETIKWSFTPMLTGKHRQSYIQKPIYNRYKKTAAEVIQDPVTFVHHWNFWWHLHKSSRTTKIFPYTSYWHFISETIKWSFTSRVLIFITTIKIYLLEWQHSLWLTVSTTINPKWRDHWFYIQLKFENCHKRTASFFKRNFRL